MITSSHFTPQEIAAAWKIDQTTVRRLFADQPGVLKIKFPRRGRRPYTTIRIPESVAAKVYEERSK